MPKDDTRHGFNSISVIEARQLQQTGAPDPAQNGYRQDRAGYLSDERLYLIFRQPERYRE